MATNNPKVVFKILILGDAMVGKSCVLQRYADDRFSDTVAPTIGVDYRPVYREFRNQLTKLMIWDTAGTEKFKSITKSFYHGAHGALVVYDVTQKDTLYALPKWIAELKHICGGIPIVIVGNKCDFKAKDKVSEEDIASFIEELGYTDRHFLISACTGENVEQAFSALINILMDETHIITDSYTVRISSKNRHTEKRCAC
ncbi:ras-related protein Rab-13-like [Argiope bruennichi]|uniref:Ras-like GTP-binding protein YPT1 n=1 Tax=Argiope bruennichi TaxID=94029 RepID=A0A8T0E808_ARGBR|nr:ras-related protein Rab-13-like [Argiope bruennichi]KAF8767959.1 Ras-like GTP-binding protein YPT1 [Argiope bruennichi]